MPSLNMKLRGNVYEGSLNSIFFAELNLIMSFSIYESLCKEWRVRCHPIKLTLNLLNQLKCDVFHNPEYSPDLAPLRRSPYPQPKMWFRCRHFVMEEDPVTEFFAKQDDEWYIAGIHKLILCYNKCLDTHGDYVEK